MQPNSAELLEKIRSEIQTLRTESPGDVAEFANCLDVVEGVAISLQKAVSNPLNFSESDAKALKILSHSTVVLRHALNGIKVGQVESATKPLSELVRILQNFKQSQSPPSSAVSRIERQGADAPVDRSFKVDVLRKEFLQDSSKTFFRLNEYCAQPEIDFEKLKEIYRLVHTIKGNASALGFEFIEQVANLTEELLQLQLPQLQLPMMQSTGAAAPCRSILNEGASLLYSLRELLLLRSEHEIAPRFEGIILDYQTRVRTLLTEYSTGLQNASAASVTNEAADSHISAGSMLQDQPTGRAHEDQEFSVPISIQGQIIHLPSDSVIEVLRNPKMIPVPHPPSASYKQTYAIERKGEMIPLFTYSSPNASSELDTAGAYIVIVDSSAAALIERQGAGVSKLGHSGPVDRSFILDKTIDLSQPLPKKLAIRVEDIGLSLRR